MDANAVHVVVIVRRELALAAPSRPLAILRCVEQLRVLIALLSLVVL